LAAHHRQTNCTTAVLHCLTKIAETQSWCGFPDFQGDLNKNGKKPVIVGGECILAGKKNRNRNNLTPKQ